jgi:hypothetical protein
MISSWKAPRSIDEEVAKQFLENMVMGKLTEQPGKLLSPPS